MKAGRTTLLLMLTLPAAGCWATGMAIDTASVESRPDEGPRSGAEPELDRAVVELAPPLGAGRTGATRPLAAAGGRRELAVPAIAVARDLDTGLPPPQLATARIILAVPDDPGAFGLAMIAAHALVDAAAADAGRPPLRALIEGVGGDITLRVDPTGICIDLTTPIDRWLTGIQALMTAATSPPNATSGIARVREELLAGLRQRLAQRDIDVLAEVLANGKRSADELIAVIEDATIEQVLAFWRLHIGPRHGVFAAWVPGKARRGVLDQIASLTEVWSQRTPVPRRLAAAPPELPDGVFWAEEERQRCTVRLALPMPDADETLGVAQLVLLEAITLDGIGGRLSRTLRETAAANVAFTRTERHSSTSRLLELTTTVEPDHVELIWWAFMRARASFLRDLPRGPEMRVAAGRARLRLLTDHGNPQQWLELVGRQALSGRPAADLTELLTHLNDPGLDLEGGARALLERPVAMMVHGPMPDLAPTGRLPVQRVDGAFLPAHGAAIPREIAGQRAAARTWAERALAAVGGRDSVTRVRGFHAALRRSSALGAAASEDLWFHYPDRLRRIRSVLSSEIETVVGPTHRVESADGRSIPLGAADVANELAEPSRHPLVLLGRWARDELPLRLVSIRNEGDREVAVLEADEEAQRLRLSIDTESGLVRTVESVVWRPDLRDLVRVVERYEDYRSVGRMRAPFWRRTVTDDGTNSITTVWQDMSLSTPEDRWFAAEPR
ncbi:MAG: hypothetical protein AAF628_04990 [Planctomycetota bacterium]